MTLSRRRFLITVGALPVFTGFGAAAAPHISELRNAVVGAWLVTVVGEERKRQLIIDDAELDTAGRSATLTARYGWATDPKPKQVPARLDVQQARPKLELTSTVGSLLIVEPVSDARWEGSIRYKDGKTRPVVLERTAPEGLAARKAVVRRNSVMTLIYVSSPQCPTCNARGASFREAWRNAGIENEVAYREVSCASIARTDRREEWPEDLAWVLSSGTNVKGGTPRFLLTVDQAVVENVFGWYYLSNYVLPVAKTLAQRKRNAAA